MNRSKLAIASLWPLGVAVAVLLPAGTAEGQTEWTKYEGNPVLEHGEPGDWDEGVVDHSDVIFDGLTYHMWYAGGWCATNIATPPPRTVMERTANPWERGNP
jgi:hypothetical protein